VALSKSFPGAGRGPSPKLSTDEIKGDGLLPSQERLVFRTTAAQLSGLVPATIGWTPDQFWAATPAELASIFAAFSDITSPNQTQLEKLKEQYPDAPKLR